MQRSFISHLASLALTNPTQLICLPKNRHFHSIAGFLLLAFYTSQGSASSASDQWALCKSHSEPPELPIETGKLTPAGQIMLTADEGEIINSDTVILQGDVHAVQYNQHLSADSAIYNKTTDELHAEGDIRYSKSDLTIGGNSADMSLNSNTGMIFDTDYMLYSRHARGAATSATVESNDITVLKNVTYTTCDINDDAWLLKSSSMRLNQQTGVGTAKNVVLTLKQIPVFYFPYLTFPIDDRRKSGFLPPSYAHSTDNGHEITIPYYINIAPQLDATLAPRFISKRGTMINGELRYLTPIDQGQLNLEYLPNDDQTEDERHLISMTDNARFSSRLTSKVGIMQVSDSDYFRDLGNSLSVSSISNLRQFAGLDYQSDAWAASALLESYQTVDDTIPDSSRPYQRLPQILFRTIKPGDDALIDLGIMGEYVDFRNDDRISGSRIDLQPSIVLPMRSPAAFLIPNLTLRYTTYKLGPDPSVTDSTPSRTLPIFSMDSGLFFEREARWGEQAMTHTLEPRLYYLYTPLRDQSDIPLFDTGQPDFNFAQLFRNNRFSGSDRIGDTNQISAALTTRFFEKETGLERMRASIGRIYYFQDREVSLNNQAETNDRSDIVAEAVASLTPQFTTRLDARLNEETNKFDKGSVQLQYLPNPHSIFNIGYRYQDTTLEQSDVSLLWPLNRHWHIIGRHNYDLLEKRALETLAGLEYQSCCWRIRVVNRRYVNDDLGDTRENLYIQFELKGLTSQGDNLESVLENGILGYKD